MSLVKLRKSYVLQVAALAVAAAALAAPAAAQTVVDQPTVISVPEVNAVNLLAPFLSLPATAIGQQTLTANLNGSIAINNFAVTSPTIEAVSISDKAIFSGPSTAITLLNNSKEAFGPGANLAGGLPAQAIQNGTANGQPNGPVVLGTVVPQQQFGGLGQLGAAYQAAVSPSGAAAPAVVTLLNNALNNFTFNDLGVVKNYFANGGANNTFNASTDTVTRFLAVAPAGFSLPAASVPGGANSVYDKAYAPTGKYTAVGPDVFGDSRPVQVSSAINVYDPQAIIGLTTNPAFTSGHTVYGFTDGILIGMMVPQYYQAMLLRSSEYANSRIDLGVHYSLDIIGSRAIATYDLAQLLNATNPAYLQTNVPSGATPLNINTQFQAAAAQLNAFLSTQTGSCGGSLTACAANNSYNTYSASTYQNAPFVTNAGTTTASINSAIYQSRLTYGLPTLSFAQAPREQAPAGGPDASILLATVYGGSTPAAQALANSVGGALYGNLSTATINQIIVNTETNAIAALYGTSLSYWARIDLYDAAGYFQNVTGSVTLASTDQLKTNVTVANTGVLGGSGTITGNVLFQAGGALGAQGNGTTAYSGLSVNGTATFQAGSKVELTGVFLPGISYTLLTTSTGNKISLDPSVIADTSASGNLMTLFTGNLQVLGDPMLVVLLKANFALAAQTPNERAVANALSNAANAGNFGPNGATLLANLIANNTVATAPAAFNALSGEGLTGQQQTALNAGNLFVTTVLGQATFWSDNRSNDIFGLKDGGSLKDSPGFEGAFAGRSRAWASGFGQYATLDGDSTAGTATLKSHSSGVATGVDYEVNRDVLAGIAGGFSNSNFSVADRATTGTVDGGHFGVYGLARSGAFYVAGVAEYAHYDNTTNRLVAGVGPVEQEKGKFSSDEWLARLEAGYKREWSGVNVTPFAGLQVTQLSNGAFSEASVGGAGVLGLHVNAQTIDSDKSFAGVQLDTKTVVGEGWVLTPYARFSWEHEFSTDRRNTAFLLALPSQSFTVAGASAAEDALRFNTGFKLDINANVAVFAAFDGEFSDRGNSYSGTGGVKFRW
jgi:outer membrane autotransporter protein